MGLGIRLHGVSDESLWWMDLIVVFRSLVRWPGELLGKAARCGCRTERVWRLGIFERMVGRFG